MKQTKDLVLVSLFATLVILLAFIPFLGYIPLGIIRATTIHIPVIIISILYGPKKGALLGFIFGLTSLINNTFSPTATSFVFSPVYAKSSLEAIYSLIICFLPRILVGVVPYYVYSLVNKLSLGKKFKKELALSLAGIAGSLTNTLLVMNFIFIFYKDAYANAQGISPESIYGFILSIIAINGIPEAIVAAFLVTLVGRVLIRSIKNI